LGCLVEWEKLHMFRDFCERARTVLELAREEARKLNHEYIGTEHILLGLVAEESSIAAHLLLHTMGVSADAIRAAVEAFVNRGSEQVQAAELPLTPRSLQVIHFARDEARQFNQQFVDTEHLLLALLREPDGVAGRLLRKLGVQPAELRAEALKTRLALMKLIEQCVRPVRASIVRKRRMREELFVHLTSIYEEELGRRQDPLEAIKHAKRRFGEPAELARELESSLPGYERISAFVERFVNYRAPESAARYSFRLAIHTFWFLMVALGLVIFGIFLGFGWIPAVRTTARLFTAIVLLTPPMQFAILLAFIKMRDAMWGGFGNRKSVGRAMCFYVLIAAVAEVYLTGVVIVASMDPSAGLEAARGGGLMSAIVALHFLVMAYLTGPRNIRDTHWALLDIDTA
jgi:ATP-dependent Clp protease ATP-binding subunit ClpC